MEWLNSPNKSPIEPDGWCGVRVCSDKGCCDTYVCWALYCGTNE